MVILKFFTRLALVASLIALLSALAAREIGTGLPPAQWIPLAASTDGITDHLYLFDVRSRLLAYLTDGESNMTFLKLSPDSRAIAYTASDQNGISIDLYSIFTGAVVPLTEAVRYTALAWSPDGAQIAFNAGSNITDIDVLNLSDHTIRRMTHVDLANGSMDWSPDGNGIVYTGTRADSTFDLYLMDAHCPADCDSNAILLTDQGSTFSPVWSPDGRTIAYVSVTDLNGEIRLLDTTCIAQKTPCTRETPAVVIQSKLSLLELLWSSDSQQIFVASFDPKAAAPVLYSISAACRNEPTCQPTKLLTLNPPRGLRW